MASGFSAAFIMSGIEHGISEGFLVEHEGMEAQHAVCGRLVGTGFATETCASL